MTVTTHTSPNVSARSGKPIYICIHRMQGSFDGTVQWFKNPSSQVSADRCVSKDGQRVAIFNRASSGQKTWATGNANSLSMSIECEGFVGDEEELSEAFFETLARQCIAIRNEVQKAYGVTIPLKHSTTRGQAGIVGHVQLGHWYGGTDHTCPGDFPYGRLLAAIARIEYREYIEVRHGTGGRRRYVVGKIVKGAGAPVRASRYVLALLRQGRKKITVTRKES